MPAPRKFDEETRAGAVRMYQDRIRDLSVRAVRTDTDLAGPATAVRPGRNGGRYCAVMVPVAGRDRPGWPFQLPAVGRRARGVSCPGVRPVTSILVVVRGRLRVTVPMVSCQPVAPVGARVGSFTVTVVPLTLRYGFQGVVIGTAVPAVAGPTAATVAVVVAVTLAAASDRV